MKIGELAALTGCRVSTIRFYEVEGLLERPPVAATTTATTALIMSTGWPSSGAAGRWT